jgi:hypothetical protein
VREFVFISERAESQIHFAQFGRFHRLQIFKSGVLIGANVHAADKKQTSALAKVRSRPANLFFGPF